MNRNKKATPMRQLQDHFKTMNSLVENMPDPYCLHRQEPRRGFDWGGHRIGARKGVFNDFVKIYQSNNKHDQKKWSIAFEINYLTVSPATICVNKRNEYGETAYSKTFEQDDFRLLMNKFNKKLRGRATELGVKRVAEADFLLILEDHFLSGENGTSPKELEVIISAKRKECEDIWAEHLGKMKVKEVEKNKFLIKRNKLQSDISGEIFNSKENQRMLEINRQILELQKEQIALGAKLAEMENDKKAKAKVAGINNQIFAIESDMKAVNQATIEQIRKVISDLPSSVQRNLLEGVTGINSHRKNY